MSFTPAPSTMEQQQAWRLRAAYAVLAVAGTVLPLTQFLPWLVAHGLAFPLLLQQAFGAPVAAFAWCDVLVSALVLLVFMLVEGRRLAMRGVWLPVAGLCLVGVSLALPLFLMMRERCLAAQRVAQR